MEKLNEFNPLVSIIIPVYNGANYMKEAIDSALAQTYKNIEVLVINDGSKDGGVTERIALSYGSKIRYFHKENGGVATALNLAIQAMKGEYFSWLSHDDVYLPEKIQLQISYLQKINRENIILYGGFYFINDKSEKLKEVKLYLENSNEFTFHHLLVSTSMNGCTALIPKKIFDDIGMFNPTLRSTQDYDMWFRMARKYEFICMKETLILSRIHEEQATNIPKPVVYEEINNIYIDVISSFDDTEICRISPFKDHKIFFYNAIIRSLRNRRSFPNAVKKLEIILYKSIIDINLVKKQSLFWRALRCLLFYTYDYKIK